MVLTLILALVSTVAVFLTALGFGLFEGGHDLSFEKIETVGYFFVQALSYSAVALLFSLLFKRAAIAVGVYFLYAFILENMLAGLLNRYVNNSGRFLPLESTDNLIPFPFLRNVVKQFTTDTNAMLLLALSAAYLIIYYVICLKKFQRDDL
jgi:ABC-type transport system involved in multi-copper enzyme maturation permease subunit